MKITSFVLAGLSVALISSASFPRPAHAEGFLSQTVKCLVQTLLLTDCQGQPAPSAPPTSQVPAQSSEPGTASSSGSASSTVSKNASASQPLSRGAALQPLATPQPQPIVNMAEPPSEMGVTPQTFNYVAYFNTYSKYANSQVESDVNMFIKPSREGWKIGGVAWYWWAIILTFSTGVIAYARHRHVRRSSALSKSL